jgi:hypothetical protein
MIFHIVLWTLVWSIRELNDVIGGRPSQSGSAPPHSDQLKDMVERRCMPNTNTKFGLLPMRRMKIDKGQSKERAVSHTNSDTIPDEPDIGRGNDAAARGVEASDVVLRGSQRCEERPHIVGVTHS